MQLTHAKDLHNGDQVTIDDTGEVVTVIDAYVSPENPGYVVIEAMTADGFKQMSHLEVS